MTVKNGVKKEVENEIARKPIEVRSIYFKKINRYATSTFAHIIGSRDLYIPAHIFIIGKQISIFIVLTNKSNKTHPKNLPIRYSDLDIG